MNKNISRRDFLKIGTGLLVGITTLPLWRFLSKQESKEKKMNNKHIREAKYYTSAKSLAG